jgi:hypothetical protein
MDAAKVVPTSILKLRPVISLKQSAMAVPAVVILPVSPEGTKVITMGFSAEPSSPAAGAAGAFDNFAQFGGGGGVAVGGTAVAASVAGASVGASVAASVGASVITSVGASVTTGASVGAGVAGAQAESTSTRIAITAKNILSDFFISFPLENWDLGNLPYKTDNTIS